MQINPELLELMQDDPDFRQEITALFESDGRRLLADLNQNLEVLDFDGIEKSTHALKGIFSNTGLDNLREQLLPIATWNREKTLEQNYEQAKQLYQELLASFEQAVVDIQQLAASI